MGFAISATGRYPLLCYGIPVLLIGLILYALPAQSADTQPQTNNTELVMGIFPRRAADVTALPEWYDGYVRRSLNQLHHRCLSR